MRIDSNQVTFLRNKIDRQIVHLLADDNEFSRRAILSAIDKLERDMARSPKNLIFAFPLALDFFRDKRAAKGRFHLRRPDFLENECRLIPSLYEITGQSSVIAKVAFESRF